MEKITGIKIESTNYLDIDKNPLEELSPISKINIFVGSNNSGKSRFLRYLFTIDNYDVRVTGYDLLQQNNLINSFIEIITNEIEKFQLTVINDKTNQYFENLRKLPNYFKTNSDVFQSHRNEFLKLTTFPNINRWEGPGTGMFNSAEQLQKTIINNSIPVINILNNIPTDLGFQNLQRTYLPVLRGLRPLSNDFDINYYREQTISDYFLDEKYQIPLKSKSKSIDIFTGMDFYNRLTDFLLGNNSERKLISEYQNFLSSIIFEGQIVELIPNQKKERVVVRVGKEWEQPIHHLGDGIQSIIILTFLPFITQEPSFFFIEEPELFLHPGIQRKILDFFSSNEGYLNKHSFFLTTHSNHFLDLTIDYQDVSIFTFRKQLPDGNEEEKEPNFIVQAVDIGDRSSLECLGVRNSSVFLVNATIWVEGITDRKYLREMLRQYVDIHKEEAGFLKIEEDVHYSFVEYGGSNITHWSFLDFEDNIAVETLCGKAYVIIDRDDPAKKLERKEELEKKLGERLKILDAREIENTLPSTVIRKVIEEYENEDVEIPDFSYEEYQYEPLGEFIEGKLGANKTREASYKVESGTIASKVAFCNKALPHIIYEELPKPTRELVELIYNHIKDQNK